MGSDLLGYVHGLLPLSMMRSPDNLIDAWTAGL